MVTKDTPPKRTKYARTLLREPDQKAKFLEELSKCGIIEIAAKKAGIYRDLHYKWKEDPEYVKLYEAAQRESDALLEAEIRRRGVLGVKQAVWYQGKKVGEEIVYSDNLLMFHAKKRMPEYRDAFKQDISLSGSVNANVSVDLSKLTQDQLDALDTLYLAASSDRSAAERNAAIDCSGKAETVTEPDS